jgi:hypothetical protein
LLFIFIISVFKTVSVTSTKDLQVEQFKLLDEVSQDTTTSESLQKADSNAETTAPASAETTTQAVLTSAVPTTEVKSDIIVGVFSNSNSVRSNFCIVFLSLLTFFILA